MNDYLLLLIYFVGSYILTFLVYMLYIKNVKKRETLMEIEYLCKKFNLPKSKVNTKKIKWLFSIVNPLIISLTFIVVISINSIIIGILVGFAIMMALIYSIYEIIGRVLKRRNNKNV